MHKTLPLTFIMRHQHTFYAYHMYMYGEKEAKVTDNLLKHSTFCAFNIFVVLCKDCFLYIWKKV